jgi:hypothetical protein
MADHIYEVAWTKTTSTAAAPFGEIIAATLAAGKRPPEIREIGVSLNTPGAGVAQIGLGQPAAIGITPGGTVTAQAANTFDTIAGNTTVATSWGTAPTAPSTFRRRFDLQAVAGAGVIWTWNPGEFVMWAGASISTIVLWQLSTQAVTYDCYLKVAE